MLIWYSSLFLDNSDARRKRSYQLAHYVHGSGLEKVNNHNINDPGINGPEGTIYDSINGPGGPFMSSYLVRPDHLCIDINGPGKT